MGSGNRSSAAARNPRALRRRGTSGSTGPPVPAPSPRASPRCPDARDTTMSGSSTSASRESTWSSWEPRDGEFRFAWMERALDRLHRAGIRAILGTPTYSIPTWLYREHPDIVVTRAGTAPELADPYSPTYPGAATPGYYGPRQNYDFLNPYFREKAERVIRQIVSHFRDHPAGVGV